MSKKRLLKIGLSHALDTGGRSREHNLHMAKAWRSAISSIPGLICIAPWIDLATADERPINRKTRQGLALLNQILEVDTLTNNLMDLVVFVVSDSKTGWAHLSEGQKFELECAKENHIPLIITTEARIDEAIQTPDDFASRIKNALKEKRANNV